MSQRTHSAELQAYPIVEGSLHAKALIFNDSFSGALLEYFHIKVETELYLKVKYI